MLLRRMSLSVLLLVASSLCLQSASGQPPQGDQNRRRGGFFGGGFGGPGGPGGGGGELMLLGNEQVQKELELIDDQIKDFAKLRDEMQAKMRDLFAGIRDLPEDQRRAKFEELRGKMETAQKELREKVDEILLPHQHDRLKEIALQLRGVGALEDPEIAEKLKLSDDQKKQLAELREAQREKMGAMFRNRSEAGGNGGGDGGGVREQFQTQRKQYEEQALAVLSAEQREQFEKLKGEKFEIDFSQLRPGGPGGPRGGRPGEQRPANPDES